MNIGPWFIIEGSCIILNNMNFCSQMKRCPEELPAFLQWWQQTLYLLLHPLKPPNTHFMHPSYVSGIHDYFASHMILVNRPILHHITQSIVSMAHSPKFDLYSKCYFINRLFNILQRIFYVSGTQAKIHKGPSIISEYKRTQF